MALILNTNIPAIKAQNQLVKHQAQSNLALERLSSGLRINSAKDDAAGLAIATRFESQINGQEVARRNAQDGISLAQTAEGAMEEITNNLQRIRDLSLQSANATNNAADRQALDDEVQQRLEEIERIASQTSFNGLNVLDGSLDELKFQVGANVGETISLEVERGVRLSQMGELAEGTLAFDDEAFTDGGLTEAQTIEIQVGEGATVSIGLEEGFTQEDIATAIEDAEVGGLAGVSLTEEGLRLRAEETITLGGDSLNDVFADPPETIEPEGSLEGTNIRSIHGANATLMRVDDAIESVNSFRSQLGAIQNRFESTINNLSNSIENLSASRSRIMDADFAAEASRLARSQVMEQAAIAMLVQANSRPQQILALLQ